jgi:glyoxylase-like metal-dependent hydrolase (beta-lactamase superfamily II)
MSITPFISSFFDPATNTVTYLVTDLQTRQAAVIDPVLDFEPATGIASTGSADQLLAFAASQGARIVLSLETHVHADHLTASAYIKAKTGAAVGIGENVRKVQAIFDPVFGLTDQLPDGADFDHLFEDGAHIALGALDIEVLHVPGHTPADVAYKIGDAVFTGDTIFMPDFGSARCDFPGGDARQLYHSVRRLLALPDETRLFCGHDYKTTIRNENRWETTVGEQRAQNIHVRDCVDEDSFVTLRMARDATLPPPRLLQSSIQVNICAGKVPAQTRERGNPVSAGPVAHLARDTAPIVSPWQSTK